MLQTVLIGSVLKITVCVVSRLTLFEQTREYNWRLVKENCCLVQRLKKENKLTVQKEIEQVRHICLPNHKKKK